MDTLWKNQQKCFLPKRNRDPMVADNQISFTAATNSCFTTTPFAPHVLHTTTTLSRETAPNGNAYFAFLDQLKKSTSWQISVFHKERLTNRRFLSCRRLGYVRPSVAEMIDCHMNKNGGGMARNRFRKTPKTEPGSLEMAPPNPISRPRHNSEYMT